MMGQIYVYKITKVRPSPIRDFGFRDYDFRDFGIFLHFGISVFVISVRDLLQNGTLQCPGEVLVCHRDGKLQTGIVPANPGRVVSLITPS
jgi:hypothetical protein